MPVRSEDQAPHQNDVVLERIAYLAIVVSADGLATEREKGGEKHPLRDGLRIRAQLVAGAAGADGFSVPTTARRRSPIRNDVELPRR